MQGDKEDLQALQDCLQEVEDLRKVFGTVNTNLETITSLTREAAAYRTTLRRIAELHEGKASEFAQLALDMYPDA